MTTRKLDGYTLQSLARRYRRDAKGPKRNYEESPKLVRSAPNDATKLFSDGELRGYWRGWYCALQQLADELRQEARAISSKPKARKGGRK